MRMYGPTLLHKKVATREDLDKLVRCVSVMPDPSIMADGATVILTQPQKGYTCTHTYRADLSGTPRWCDITNDCGPANRVFIPDGVGLACFYEEVASADDSYYTDPDHGKVEHPDSWLTGYLKVWWTPAPSVNEIAGPLTHEIVVRKLRDYPEHPGDGEVIVRAPAGTVYTEDHPYKFDDSSYGLGMMYYYTVFHMYASGWWSYTKGPLVPALHG